MFTCRALIEACLLVEEGISSVRDIDLGMMTGAGLDPRKGLLPPFWKADVEGLDKMLEKIEGLEEKHGERFAPPITLRRLVAQGRPGITAGQGFYAYPQPDEGEQPEKVKLETRGPVAIAWLANAPMNAVHPQVIADLKTVWEKIKADDGVHAMVIASSVPIVFSAGADIKAFTTMDEAGGRRCSTPPTPCSASSKPSTWRRSPRSTRSLLAAAARWRWPVTSASPRRPRSSASRRSSWGSSPASAAPSGCRVWSARTRPWR